MMFTMIALTPMLSDVRRLFGGFEAVVAGLPGPGFDFIGFSVGECAVSSGFGFRDDAAYRMFIRAGHGGGDSAWFSGDG